MSTLQVLGYSVKPHCLVSFAWDMSGKNRNARPAKNINDGYLSEKQAYRLKNAINWMNYLSEGKFYFDKTTKKKYPLRLNMITLTLCSKQSHTDTIIVHKLLRPFLKWLNRKGNALYVWRAEAQTNGNIHFHITGNKFINKESIQHKWNSLLLNYGYIKAYIQAGGDGNPPSTKVNGNQQSHKLAKYLVKYMSKAHAFKSCQRFCDINDKPTCIPMINDYRKTEDGFYEMIQRPMTCKQWGCSDELLKQRRNISELDFYWKIFDENVKRETRRLPESMYDVRVYNSLTARDYFFTLQRNTNHISPLTLHNESFRKEGVSCKLGKGIKALQVPRQLYMSALWGETKRHEGRQQTLLPCHYIGCSYRPLTNQSRTRKSNKPVSKLPLQV